jgi:hypothetical protein
MRRFSQLSREEQDMKLVAVTASEFGALRWAAPKGYALAAGDAVSGLVVQEVPIAVLTMPVAFVRQKDEFIIAAVQGLQQGKNLYIAPDGRWRAGYIPAAYRAYPFAVATNESAEQVLCFDKDSNLITESGGEPFYDEDGQLSGKVKKIAEFLAQVIQNRVLTKSIVSLLDQHNLIHPWPISYKNQGGEQTVNGLHRIDEAALKQLPADALKQLSDAGALSVAYLQLLSTHHLPRLVEMTIADAAAPEAKKSVELDFLKEDQGSLDFSFL